MIRFRSALATLTYITAILIAPSAAWSKQSHATLSIEQRVACQKTIEDIRWSHRIWPESNPTSKPPRSKVLSDAQIRDKVEDSLHMEAALAKRHEIRITAAMLQSELNRMANDTRMPVRLWELFDALGNGPQVIAECMAKPRLVEELFRRSDGRKGSVFGGWWGIEKQSLSERTTATGAHSPDQRLVTSTTKGDPSHKEAEGSSENWSATSTSSVPSARYNHTAVWTGSEMIVWGGKGPGNFATGGRYDPVSDSWSAVSTSGAPTARSYHSAVWSGSEMIIWGGSGSLATGARYNPSSGSWTATTTTSAPTGRYQHTAIWTGSEMIIWGGYGGGFLASGGRYNPGSDSWTVTNTVGAPTARLNNTSVWTGSEMIIWGGAGAGGVYSLDGGRFNPTSNTWTTTASVGAPLPRETHAAVWNGSEMIIWGGYDGSHLATGGRYSPGSNSWIATGSSGVPAARTYHTAIWNGSEMVIWGGENSVDGNLDTGGRYSPVSNTWSATTMISAPGERRLHTAIWADNEMIIWGGRLSNALATGGRYSSISSYSVGGSLSLLAAGNSVVLQSNGTDDLSLSANGGFNFVTELPDGSPYVVTVLTQPTTPAQTCSISNGSGTISGGNVTNVAVHCNSEPVATTDTYDTNEDTTLTADDADGTANGNSNDNGVLANDSDDGSLWIVGPGAFTAGGIGGTVTIAADGTFAYGPPADQSGEATFAFSITDGLHTVPSSLTINVLPVNDPPSFVGSGDPTFTQGGRGAVQVNNWAGSMSAGPPDEAGQQLSFSTSITADPDGVLNSASVGSSGNLQLDLTSEGGTASLEVVLMDDGGGDDQSTPVPAEVIVTRAGDLVTTVNNGVDVLPAGTTVLYQITVDNKGPADVSNALLSATIPPELVINGPWSCIGTGGASCPASGPGDLAESVNLPLNSQVVFDIFVDVPASPEQPVSFSANAQMPGDTQENSATDNSDSDDDHIGVFGSEFERPPLP